MNNKEAFQIVLSKLKECNLFYGFYDARNAKKDFINGSTTEYGTFTKRSKSLRIASRISSGRFE